MKLRVRERLATAAGTLIALRIGWRRLTQGRRRREAERAEVQSLKASKQFVVASDPQAIPADEDPRRRDVPADRAAETLVALLLLAAAVCAVCFVVVYVADDANTQLLGLALGICMALLAGAAIIAGKLVVPQETAVEPRDQLLKQERTDEVIDLIAEGGEGVSRRGLLVCAGCAAGGAVAAAVAVPLASLGPAAGTLHNSPWKRGIRLVDDVTGKPYLADQIEVGTFYTALPEGKDPELLGSGVLLVRLPRRYIHLPLGRRGWAPHGLLAYSKICPHAECAISLYRYPTYGPTSVEQPAFTCPCHYSTFLPGEGGKVIFGPAGRALPQLPLMLDDLGHVTAAGNFNEDVGASWWGVRRT